ncbi:MAG UNVERIFIED_CONTAM: hypothetical protein LVR29_21460 [Microcystis novacekii LVE1205-3]|jgi:predicted ATPase
MDLIIPLDNNYKVPLLLDLEELSNNRAENSLSVCYKFLHDSSTTSFLFSYIRGRKKRSSSRDWPSLLKNVQEDDLHNHLFDIVNHFNKGATLITKQSEKYELAQLNLQAGRKKQKLQLLMELP